MPNKLEAGAERAVPRLSNWGWRMYNQPGSITAAAPAAQAGTGTIGASGVAEGAGLAGGYGTANLGAGTGGTMAQVGAAQGGSSMGSMGATGMSTSGALSLIAPLVMTYMAYTAGSGVNEPIRKQYETAGMGRLLTDMSKGKEIDQKGLYRDYGIKPKTLPAWLDPNSQINMAGEAYGGPGSETLDPRGYSAQELYEGMHGYGSGHKQSGGVGNSGLSDQQVDEGFGASKDDIAKMLGYTGGLPDWTGKTWDQAWKEGNGNILPQTSKGAEIDKQYAALDESGKGDLLRRNQRWLNPELSAAPAADEKILKEMLRAEQEQAELEKMLGYRLTGSGGGNPNPGGSQPFETRYPTAMSDSGEYIASNRVPASNTMEWSPEDKILYQIMQTQGRKPTAYGI